MLIVGLMYWKFTQDCPQGNFKELRAEGVSVGSDKKGGVAILMHAAKNYRVWILFGAVCRVFRDRNLYSQHCRDVLRRPI